MGHCGMCHTKKVVSWTQSTRPHRGTEVADVERMARPAHTGGDGGLLSRLHLREVFPRPLRQIRSQEENRGPRRAHTPHPADLSRQRLLEEAGKVAGRRHKISATGESVYSGWDGAAVRKVKAAHREEKEREAKREQEVREAERSGTRCTRPIYGRRGTPREKAAGRRLESTSSTARRSRVSGPTSPRT